MSITSEEENKAIEWLKDSLFYLKENNYLVIEEYDTLKILLNLIEKQQKEIEDLEQKVLENKFKGIEEEVFEEMRKEIEDLKGENVLLSIKGDTISKDKIREKIKEYDKWIEEGGDYTESLEAQKYALEELLEEN